jgi:hypothetical protein
MMRVTSLLSRSAALAFVTLLALAPVIARADSSFSARSSVSGIPSFFGVPTGNKIVVYALPTAAASPLYGGPVNATFDLTAVTTGATEPVTGFGMIATVNGTGGVVFNPDAIAPGPAPDNNIEYSVSTPSNSNLDIMYAVTNVQSGGVQSIGVVALNDVPATNITLANNDGLAAIPIQVAGGTGFNASHFSTFNVTFGTDPTYTGFINAAGQIVTNPAQHVNATIEVRESRRGDMNGDGPVNLFDLDGFVSALAGTFTTPYLHPQWLADFDNSNAVNLFDLDGFVAALAAGSPTAGSPSAIPEPSTFVIAGLGIVLLCVRRRFRRK